ncbi:hypothetical protein JCM11641_008262 [Rhodosporidiobolus odoratus]
MQRRYSSQIAESHPAPTPTSTSSSSILPPPPPGGPAASSHARYSSADLYALENHLPTKPIGPGSRSGSALWAGNNAWDPEDSSDEDDGPGFGNYTREEGPKSRRASQTLSVQEKQRNSKRMSMGAAPLISYPSSHSTLPSQAYLGQQQQHPSMSSFTPSPYALPYSAVPGGTPSSTSFGKLPTAADVAAGRTVQEPILSKQDWNRGEALREKNTHERGKKRQAKDAAIGEVTGIWRWLRRRWKWVLPLAILFAVGLILVCYFCIPRTPTITFTSNKVPANAFTSSDDAPYVSSAEPTAFSFDGSLTFAIDASDSYIPVHYRSFGLTVKLIDTGGTIAHTVWDNGEIKVAGKKVTSYEFPITFHGNYSSDSDRTYQAMRSACAHKYANIYRPPLNLTVKVESSITGVVNPPVRTAQLRGVNCPIEWASTAS